MPWKFDGVPVSGKTMYDFYNEYWRPFGEILVRMESEGMLVDRAYLEGIEKVAKAEQEIAVDRFRKWACRYCPDAKYMNVGSDLQLRQLLFGGTVNRCIFFYFKIFMSTTWFNLKRFIMCQLMYL
jgi:DNA polymerase-1